MSLSACDTTSGELSDASYRAASANKGMTVGTTTVTEPAINTSDSWVAAVMTIEHKATLQAPNPITDAKTGQSTQLLGLDEPPEVYIVQAGYETDGSMVMVQTLTGPSGDPLIESVNHTRTTRVDDGYISFSDDQGDESYGTTAGAGPDLRSAMNVDAQDPLQVLGGLVAEQVVPLGGTGQFGGVRTFSYGTIQATQVVTPAPGKTVVHEVVTPSDASGPVTMRRYHEYDAQEDVHILEKVEVDVNMTSEGFTLSGMTVITFDNVSWNRNKPEDDARGTETWGTTTNSLVPHVPHHCGPGGDADQQNPDLPGYCPEPPIGGGGTTGGNNCANEAGGANIIYVHGIDSNGATWDKPGRGLQRLARCEFEVERDETPTLGNDGLDSHNVQEAALKTAMQSYGTPNNILIGHSQGGLISRRVAQDYSNSTSAEYDANAIRGVVTIGTPHDGAVLVDNYASAVGTSYEEAVAGEAACSFFGPLCSLVDQVAQSVVRVGVSFTVANDAGHDLRPNSPAIQQVNNGSEPFPRYGIRHEASKAWTLSRLGGDLLSGNGPTWVTGTWVAVGAATAVATVGIFAPWSWAVVAVSVRFVYHMYTLNRWWNRISTGDQRGDGIVQAGSQEYPGADRNLVARDNPTSHTGETATRRSYEMLNGLLESDLLVVPRN